MSKTVCSTKLDRGIERRLFTLARVTPFIEIQHNPPTLGGDGETPSALLRASGNKTIFYVAHDVVLITFRWIAKTPAPRGFENECSSYRHEVFSFTP